MSLMDMFRTTPPAAPVTPVVPGAPPVQTAPGPVAPGNIPPNVDPNAAPPVGVVPVQDPNAPAIPDAPMAEFATLWDTPVIDPNAPAAPPAPVALTADAINKVVANANFASGVTPEQMAAIAEGGEGAQAAMVAMINGATQQAVTQSILASNKLHEKAMSEALAKQATELPGMLREQQTASHLTDLNPLFSNPAMQPVIEATRSQLLLKFPGDTPAQTNQKLQDYMVAMGKQFAPQEAVNSNSAQEPDWEAFLKS